MQRIATFDAHLGLFDEGQVIRIAAELHGVAVLRGERPNSRVEAPRLSKIVVLQTQVIALQCNVDAALPVCTVACATVFNRFAIHADGKRCSRRCAVRCRKGRQHPAFRGIFNRDQA